MTDAEQHANVRVVHLPTFARRAGHENAAHVPRQDGEMRSNAHGVRLTRRAEVREHRAPKTRNAVRCERHDELEQRPRRRTSG